MVDEIRVSLALDREGGPLEVPVVGGRQVLCEKCRRVNNDHDQDRKDKRSRSTEDADVVVSGEAWEVSNGVKSRPTYTIRRGLRSEMLLGRGRLDWGLPYYIPPWSVPSPFLEGW